MSDQKWWLDNKVLRRITRVYSREDNRFPSCPGCGDLAEYVYAVDDAENVKGELRCASCGHMERKPVITTTKTGAEVYEFPYGCYHSNLNATGVKLLAFLLWDDRCQEVG